MSRIIRIGMLFLLINLSQQSYAQPCLKMQDVDFKLDSISQHYLNQNFAIPVFAELYEGMVEQQILWVSQQKIKEPELMQRMISGFYLLFENAILDFYNKDSFTTAWKHTFENNAQNAAIKSLFLSVNAHVFHDLSLALSQSFHTQELEDFKHDFFEINRLFDKGYYQITKNLSQVCHLSLRQKLYFNVGRKYFITNFKKQRKRAYKMAMTVNLDRKTFKKQYKKQEKRVQKNMRRIDKVFEWEIKLIQKLKELDKLPKDYQLQLLKTV